MTTLGARLVAEYRRQLSVHADPAVERPWGFACRRPEEPNVWDHNALVVERADGLGDDPAATLLAEVDALYAGMRFRKLHVLDDALGVALSAPLAARGFEIKSPPGLIAAGPPPAPRPGTPPVVAADVAATEGLQLRWMEEELKPGSQATPEELVAAFRGETDRAFLSPSAAAPVAYAAVRQCHDPGLMEITDVYALPEARGTGHGAAVLLGAWRAAHAAGREAVYLWAERRAVPFYERLGWRPEVRAWEFLRLV